MQERWAALPQALLRSSQASINLFTRCRQRVCNCLYAASLRVTLKIPPPDFNCQYTKAENYGVFFWMRPFHLPGKFWLRIWQWKRGAYKHHHSVKWRQTCLSSGAHITTSTEIRRENPMYMSSIGLPSTKQICTVEIWWGMKTLHLRRKQILDAHAVCDKKNK